MGLFPSAGYRANGSGQFARRNAAICALSTMQNGGRFVHSVETIASQRLLEAIRSRALGLWRFLLQLRSDRSYFQGLPPPTDSSLLLFVRQVRWNWAQVHDRPLYRSAWVREEGSIFFFSRNHHEFSYKNSLTPKIRNTELNLSWTSRK